VLPCGEGPPVEYEAKDLVPSDTDQGKGTWQGAVLASASSGRERVIMMERGWFWDLLVMVAVVLLLLRPTIQGVISPELAALFLALLVTFRAIGRAVGKGLGRAVRLAFTVGLPLTSLLIFAVSYSQGNPREATAILGALGALILMLLGLYIMFRGLFL